MPQMSPMNWTIIILTLMTFLSVTSSNMPKTNKIISPTKKITPMKKTMKW